MAGRGMKATPKSIRRVDGRLSSGAKATTPEGSSGASAKPMTLRQRNLNECVGGKRVMAMEKGERKEEEEKGVGWGEFKRWVVEWKEEMEKEIRSSRRSAEKTEKAVEEIRKGLCDKVERMQESRRDLEERLRKVEEEVKREEERREGWEKRMREMEAAVKRMEEEVRKGSERAEEGNDGRSGSAASGRSWRTGIEGSGSIGESSQGERSDRSGLSDREIRIWRRKIEEEEEMDRKENLVVKGWKPESRERNWGKELEIWLDTKLGVKCEIERYRKSGGALIIKIKKEEKRNEIMRNKAKLKGEEVYIEKDRSWGERREQEKIMIWAGRQRRLGKEVRVKKGAVVVNGRWYRWSDIERREREGVRKEKEVEKGERQREVEDKEKSSARMEESGGGEDKERKNGQVAKK